MLVTGQMKWQRPCTSLADRSYVIGTMVTQSPRSGATPTHRIVLGVQLDDRAFARSSLTAGLVFMALAVLFGLLHRYLAIDYMCTLVEMKRAGAARFDDWRLKASTFAILVAPLSLLAGASLLFIAVAQVLGANY
jgi:hypothetical protein